MWVYLRNQFDGVVIGLDADGLVVDEALVLPAVLVQEVQRVAGELDDATAAESALGEEGVVAACISRSLVSMHSMSSIYRRLLSDRLHGWGWWWTYGRTPRPSPG